MPLVPPSPRAPDQLEASDSGVADYASPGGQPAARGNQPHSSSPFWLGTIVGAALSAFAFAWYARSGAPVFVSPSGGAQAINAAIKRLAPDGGEIRLGPGIYLCREPIVINTNGITLRGAGASTRLKLADNANCPVLIVGDTANEPGYDVLGVCISSFAIDGNRYHQSGECWGGSCDDGSKSAIRSSGVVLRRAIDARVEELSISSCRSGGLVTERGCRRLTVCQLDADDNEFDGLACYQTEDSLFTDLRLYRNKAAGISLDLHFDHNLIMNAFLTQNGTHGIFMRDSHENSFQGVMVHGSGRDGIFVDQVDEDVKTGASGNSFIGLHVTGCGRDAVRINGRGCLNNLIDGCQFAYNKGGGLSEAVPGLVKFDAALKR